MLFFILAFIHFCVWMDSRAGCVSKLKFNHFKGLYNANPMAWKLHRITVGYQFYGMYEEKEFYFGIIDLLRYQMWNAKKEDLMIKESKNRDLERCIHMWQKDLDEYKKTLGKECGGWKKDETVRQ